MDPVSGNQARIVRDQPAEIDFDRGRVRHISFGAGPHRCLGIHFATMEIQIAVEEPHRHALDCQGICVRHRILLEGSRNLFRHTSSLGRPGSARALGDKRAARAHRPASAPAFRSHRASAARPPLAASSRPRAARGAARRPRASDHCNRRGVPRFLPARPGVARDGRSPRRAAPRHNADPPRRAGRSCVWRFCLMPSRA